MRFPLQALLTLMLISPMAYAQGVISESDFAGWSGSKLSESAGTSSGSVVTTGNPGDAWRIHLSGNGSIFGNSEFSSLRSWASDQPWDSATQGTISNLSFQVDLMANFGNMLSLRVHPMLVQGGQFFVANSQSISFTNGAWTTQGPLPPLADETLFNLQVSPDAFNSSIHPDFAVNAAPIEVGIFANAEGRLGSSEDIFLDNFSVTFDVEPPTFSLSQTPLIRSVAVVFTAEEAQPNEIVYFYLTKAGIGPGPCFPQFGGLCLDILGPVLPIGLALTDATGTANFFTLVPPNAPLISIHTQAVIRRGIGGVDSIISNTVTGIVQP